MLQPATLSFMSGLAANNNKPWFEAHKDEYLVAKTDFEAVTDQLLGLLAETDAELKGLAAKDCVMRIYRDVRFSKDKTPYKTNFGAGISKGGRKFAGAGYYLHIEPGGKSFVGGGMWQPEPAILKKIRQDIDYNYADFLAIVEEPAFRASFPQIDGERLKKVPQGYTDDNPAAEYLKLKSFTIGAQLTDEEVVSKGFVAQTAKLFAVMRPFITYLNRAVD